MDHEKTAECMIDAALLDGRILAIAEGRAGNELRTIESEGDRARAEDDFRLAVQTGLERF